MHAVWNRDKNKKKVLIFLDRDKMGTKDGERK